MRDFADASWAFIAEELGFEKPSGAHMLYSRATTKLAARMGGPGDGSKR